MSAHSVRNTLPQIDFEAVSKYYDTADGRQTVLHRGNFSILFGTNFGIIGGRGSGKSTLMRLLAGLEYPSSGRIRRTGTVSWPLGRNAGFPTHLTAEDHIRFICDLYALGYLEVRAFVAEFTGLGQHLKSEMTQYSSGMRGRLMFALSLAAPFDFYLIDEGVRAGEKDFQRSVDTALVKRNLTSTLVIVSGSEQLIRQYCARIGVLSEGRLQVFDNVEDGLVHFRQVERQRLRNASRSGAK